MDIPHLTNCLCGKSRPHFFGGVMAIVMRLFLEVAPDFAIFGEKDYQQLMVISGMVQSFVLPIKIISVPTFREKSGLAFSSRNGYLTQNAKIRAKIIFETLISIATQVKSGKKATQSIIDEAKQNIISAGFSSIDYLEIRSEADLSPTQNSGRIFFAGFIDGVRLIDNISI